jgi:hypothetical protein
VDHVERPGDEHEGELERLGHAGQEAGQCGADHDAADSLLLRGLGLLPDRQGGGRQGEHHDGEEAGHERSGLRVAVEEPLDVAGVRDSAGLVLTEQEPRTGVEDVVQAQRDQQPVERAVDEATDDVVVGNPVGDVLEAFVERRVDQAEQDRDDDRRERRDHGDETPPSEERQVVGQLDPVVALPQQTCGDAHDDAAQDAVVDQLLGAALGRRVQDERRHRIPDALEHEVADDGCECGGAVGLLGQADRHADREEQRQVGEQCVAGCAHHGGDLDPAPAVSTEQVRLSEPEQQGRCWQGSDRQHEAATELL